MTLVENWVSRPTQEKRVRKLAGVPDEQPTPCSVCRFRDDDTVCGYGWCPGEEDPWIGDYVHTFYGDDAYEGIVIGVIRNIAEQPVCYKVVVVGHTPPYIDFFAAQDTHFDDRTGWSIYETAIKLGYVPVTKDQCKLYNKELDDVFYV